MVQPHRTVVVTGASAGLGRAVGRAFAQRGFRVALLARSETGLDSARREIEAHGGTALPFPVDVGDADALFRAAEEIVAAWGSIDIWINSAMVTVFAPLSSVTAEEYRRVTQTTYLGCVHGTMAALRHMRARNQGTIVQIGSALSYRAIPLQSAYCGAKFAIRGFTDSLRSELQHEHSAIRLTMVQLPAVNTPQFDWARNKMERVARPLPRVFQPEPIAEHIVRTALSPPRELWIGWPAMKAIVGTMLMPGYLDRRLAREAYEGQLSDERLPLGHIDNLDAAVPAGYVTRGRFEDEAKSHVAAFSPSSLRIALALFAAALLAIALI